MAGYEACRSLDRSNFEEELKTLLSAAEHATKEAIENKRGDWEWFESYVISVFDVTTLLTGAL